MARLARHARLDLLDWLDWLDKVERVESSRAKWNLSLIKFTTLQSTATHAPALQDGDANKAYVVDRTP